MIENLPTKEELQVKIAELQTQREQMWARYAAEHSRFVSEVATDPRFYEWAGEPPPGVTLDAHRRDKLTELLAPYEPAAVRARMDAEDAAPAPTSDRAVQAFRAKLGGAK